MPTLSHCILFFIEIIFEDKSLFIYTRKKLTVIIKYFFFFLVNLLIALDSEHDL